MENRLDGLPNIKQNAEYFNSLQVKFLESGIHFFPDIYFKAIGLIYIFSLLMFAQVNVSLSELYGYTQSFKLHVDWLKTVKENHTLSTQSSSNASTHLLQLSNQLNASLQQVRKPATFMEQ